MSYEQRVKQVARLKRRIARYKANVEYYRKREPNSVALQLNISMLLSDQNALRALGG